MTFEELNLNNPLWNALEEMGYIYSTPIQSEALPVIMSGKDLVGIAQTGTGKTFAYLLPILRLHKFSKEKHPRVLILVPTRELVVQVCKEVEKLAKYINVRTVGVYGGTNINTQKKAVVEGVDILVATPGRLVDLVMHGALKLSNIKKLVIDEVDEMLNLGFRTQLNNILDLLPERKQNLLFSATLGEEVDQLIKDNFYQPRKIEIVPQGTPIERIDQRLYGVPNFFTKINLLAHLLETDEEMKKVLVFVSTKRLADRLFEHISPKFPDQIGIIHSNKSQNFRLNAISTFEKEEIKVLVATDIIARGLDILDVSHVVNFDIPNEAASYIHRIGRTGRADKDGCAISFSNEVEMEYMMAIQELMGKALEMQDLPEDVEVSDIFTDEEKPQPLQKNYLPHTSIKESQGNFHDKKDKNKKVNLGGSYRRKLKAKYKKPKTRGGKR